MLSQTTEPKVAVDSVLQIISTWGFTTLGGLVLLALFSYWIWKVVIPNDARNRKIKTRQLEANLSLTETLNSTLPSMSEDQSKIAAAVYKQQSVTNAVGNRISEEIQGAIGDRIDLLGNRIGGVEIRVDELCTMMKDECSDEAKKKKR